MAAITPSDAAHAIVVENFESFPVLHVERPRLTAIEQEGPDYWRVDSALGVVRDLPF